MSKVRRIYVEKKDAYAVKAKDLKKQFKDYLGIKADNVRVLTRYDMEGVSEDTYNKAKVTIFSEPPIDVVYEESFPMNEKEKCFSQEYLPGQFDQRADSAEQCVKLLNEEEEPVIRTATTYVIEGDITEEQLEAIKHHCINPVDSRETGMEKPETLVTEFPEPADVKITNTATKATVAVKSISAKKGVENTYVIETFTGMTDAKEYSVVYADSTAVFTATDNTVAKVDLTKTEVPAGVKTEVKAVTKDANNIILGYFDLTNGNTSNCLLYTSPSPRDCS